MHARDLDSVLPECSDGLGRCDRHRDDNAVWIVRRAKDGRSQTGRTTVREPTGDKSFDALAAAHSRALARLSQDVADAIRALDRAAP